MFVQIEGKYTAKLLNLGHWHNSQLHFGFVDTLLSSPAYSLD